MTQHMDKEKNLKDFFYGSFQTAFGIVIALVTVWIVLKITTSQGYDSLRDIDTDEIENPLNSDEDFE